MIVKTNTKVVGVVEKLALRGHFCAVFRPGAYTGNGDATRIRATGYATTCASWHVTDVMRVRVHLWRGGTRKTPQARR